MSKSLVNDARYKCSYCQEFIDDNPSEHEKACKLYSKCMKKIQDGYQCQICSKELQTSAQMFAHILFHVTPEIERKTQEGSLQSNKQISSLKEPTGFEKPRCNYCQDLIPENCSTHESTCKLYSKFINELPWNRIECKVCQQVCLSRSEIFAHLRTKHTEIEKKQEGALCWRSCICTCVRSTD